MGFWHEKRLEEMTVGEWESLCDGCAKCCLLKVEWEDTGEVEPTSVVCRLLDSESCACTDYANRSRWVPECIRLTPETIGLLDWMPTTCAYRLIHEGRELYWWHPLVSGSRDTVHLAQVSVRGKVISEEDIDGTSDDLTRYVVDWRL